MSYWCGSPIVFFRWVSVETKPHSDKDDYEDSFNENDDQSDGSVEVFEPPYGQKGLHGDSLQAKVLIRIARVRIKGYQRSQGNTGF